MFQLCRREKARPAEPELQQQQPHLTIRALPLQREAGCSLPATPVPLLPGMHYAGAGECQCCSREPLPVQPTHAACHPTPKPAALCRKPRLVVRASGEHTCKLYHHTYTHQGLPDNAQHGTRAHSLSCCVLTGVLLPAAEGGGYSDGSSYSERERQSSLQVQAWPHRHTAAHTSCQCMRCLLTRHSQCVTLICHPLTHARLLPHFYPPLTLTCCWRLLCLGCLCVCAGHYYNNRCRS